MYWLGSGAQVGPATRTNQAMVALKTYIWIMVGWDFLAILLHFNSQRWWTKIFIVVLCMCISANNCVTYMDTRGAFHYVGISLKWTTTTDFMYIFVFDVTYFPNTGGWIKNNNNYMLTILSITDNLGPNYLYAISRLVTTSGPTFAASRHDEWYDELKKDAGWNDVHLLVAEE